MDTAKICASLQKAIFSFVLVLFITSAWTEADRTSLHGHHNHGESTAQGNITVIEEETTNVPHETHHEKHILSDSDDSNSTAVHDGAHGPHKHQPHDHEFMHPDIHNHQSQDTPEIAADHEMVLDQAPPSDVVKLSLDDKNKYVEEDSSFMKHHSHSMSHMGHDAVSVDMDSNSSMPHMMMVFHIRIDEIVLFQQWKITNLGEMIASMVGVALLALLYEGLKFLRDYLFKQSISSMQFSTIAVTEESGGKTQVHKIERHRMMSLAHILQTGLHIVQVVISYFLMLIFMTYNVWLCASVVVGSAIGFFMFGWKKATVVDITEHCH